MGAPLSARESPPDNEALAAALDEALARAMHTLGQSVEGVGELTQAQLEWARRRAACDFGGIAARRACCLRYIGSRRRGGGLHRVSRRWWRT